MYYILQARKPLNSEENFVDIKEFYPTGKLVHSKNGVRFPIVSHQKLKSLMKTCNDNTIALMKTSCDLVNEVKLFMVERDIRESRLLQNGCDVCLIDHKEAIKKSGLCKDLHEWKLSMYHLKTLFKVFYF